MQVTTEYVLPPKITTATGFREWLDSKTEALEKVTVVYVNKTQMHLLSVDVHGGVLYPLIKELFGVKIRED